MMCSAWVQRKDTSPEVAYEARLHNITKQVLRVLRMSRMWLPGEDTKRHLLIEKVNYESSNSRMFILYWGNNILYI